MDQMTQPLGFLSKIGAKAAGDGHMLMMWQGTALSDAAWGAHKALSLSTKPRYHSNLAMASYPFTKIFAYQDRIFTLQVAPVQDESKVLDRMNKPDELPEPRTDLLVDLSEVNSCNNKLTIAKVTQLQWPRGVKRSTDFLCQNYANEEATLTLSSPSILHDKAYSSRMLLLNVKNSLHAYDLTETLQKPRLCAAQANLPQILTTGPLYKGIKAQLPGTTHADYDASAATSQVTIQGETAYVLNSFNTIQSIDMSLWVPCGRVLYFLRPHFKSWGVAAGASKKAETKLGLKRFTYTNAAEWKCTTMKTVKNVDGAILTKNTACCSPSLSDGHIPCCVEKSADVQDAAQVTPVFASKLANELGAM